MLHGLHPNKNLINKNAKYIYIINKIQRLKVTPHRTSRINATPTFHTPPPTTTSTEHKQAKQTDEQTKQKQTTKQTIYKHYDNAHNKNFHALILIKNST